MSAMPGLGEEVSEVYKQDGSSVALLLFERAMIVWLCAIADKNNVWSCAIAEVSANLLLHCLHCLWRIRSQGRGR